MEFPWKVTPEVPLYICELHLMNHEPFLINTLNVLQSSYHQIRSISSHCDKPFTMNVFVFTMVFTWLIQVNSDSWVDSHSLIELFEYAGVMGCTKLFPIGSEFGNNLVIAFSSQWCYVVALLRWLWCVRRTISIFGYVYKNQCGLSKFPLRHCANMRQSGSLLWCAGAAPVGPASAE